MYRCKHGCKPESATPFVYPPCCMPHACGVDDHDHSVSCLYEMGVLVYPDLSISNFWRDGTKGVSLEIVDYLDDHDCLPVCVECGEDIEEVKP
jgi:hypothetical protein